MSSQDDARRLVEAETQRLKAARIAAYIADLKRMDWDFEFSDDQRVWWRGNDALAALKAQQFDLDPDLRIWNEHAPEQYRRKA